MWEYTVTVYLYLEEECRYSVWEYTGAVHGCVDTVLAYNIKMR